MSCKVNSIDLVPPSDNARRVVVWIVLVFKRGDKIPIILGKRDRSKQSVVEPMAREESYIHHEPGQYTAAPVSALPHHPEQQYTERYIGTYWTLKYDSEPLMLAPLCVFLLISSDQP